MEKAREQWKTEYEIGVEKTVKEKIKEIKETLNEVKTLLKDWRICLVPTEYLDNVYI